MTNLEKMIQEQIDKHFLKDRDTWVKFLGDPTNFKNDLALAISKECFKDTFTLAQIEEEIEMSTGVNAIPETNDYANGWNDCRKRAFQEKKKFVKDLIARLKEGK